MILDGEVVASGSPKGSNTVLRGTSAAHAGHPGRKALDVLGQRPAHGNISQAQAAPASEDAAEEDYLEFKGQHAPVWNLKATKGGPVGGYGDNFGYDESRVVAVGGEAEVLLDVDKDIGKATATLTATINPEKRKTFTSEIKLVYSQLMGVMPSKRAAWPTLSTSTATPLRDLR